MENNHETIQTAEEMVVELPFDDMEETVCIPISEYRELVIKANALDMLADDIRYNIDNDASSYSIIDDDLVRALTGTKHYTKPVHKVLVEAAQGPEEQNE